MEDRYIEIEPYEEIVDRDEMFSTPSGSRSASPVSVDRSLPPAQSPSQGPSTSVYNTNLITSVMRPDPRYELALASQVPHTQTEHPDTSAEAVTNREIYIFHLYSTPPPSYGTTGWPRRNFAKVFSTGENQNEWASVRWRKYDDTLSRFDAIPQHDRQTDGRT